jgi:hypothetical protein
LTESIACCGAIQRDHGYAIIAGVEQHGFEH